MKSVYGNLKCFLEFSVGAILFFVAFLFMSVSEVYSCTSVIVSAKASADGRPILWKHRDTGAGYNHIIYSDSCGYPFIGLENSNKDGDIWIGTNTMGFSIMNTASFNLKDDDVEVMDHEGKLIRRALEVCKSMDDFEHFLDTLTRPMRVEANFGVIDAYGGAAYFETNNSVYYKKDVNDISVAPDGYLIYTNFSFEGRKDEGFGYVRYESAKKLFSQIKSDGITPEEIFLNVSSSFYHSLFDADLMDDSHSPNVLTQGWTVEQDYISRKESTASIVIQGIKPGEDPSNTIMWTELGYPPLSIALPLWVKLGDNLPQMVRYDETFKTAPLCFYSNELMKNVYPIRKGNGQKYIHWEKLISPDGNGYIQKIRSVWKIVYDKFSDYITKYSDEVCLSEDNRKEELDNLYDEVQKMVYKFYEDLLEKQKN